MTSPVSGPVSAPIRLAVIISSTRSGRRGPVFAQWFVDTVAGRDDIDIDLIDPLELGLPEQWTFAGGAELDAFRARIAAADAFVVVTAEYNHSFTGAIKHVIDLAKGQWARKVVGFVSYGGVSGGLRAVEQLRLVFAELHVHGVRDTVSFHGPWNGFGDDDQPTDPAGATAAATLLVDELVWWARALRIARTASPAD